MNCLCCGKALKSGASSGWHNACIKRFFGTKEIPTLDISAQTLELLASESVRSGHTVPGVQKKLSLHLFSEKSPRLTLLGYPTGYILKPQVAEFSSLPEAEHLVMCMAEQCGIATVPHALVQIDDEYAYITKRVDRELTTDVPASMLAMEDFCQLDLRLTQDKYRGSYERCAKVIDRYSSHKQLDMTELLLRLLFCYLVGNSDMHLKNFSLIETASGSREYILSPAYDLLPVNVIMPEDTEEFALTMNGKKQNLRKKDFVVFAETCGIEKKVVEKMVSKLISMQPKFEEMIAQSLLPESLKMAFSDLLKLRISTFQ